MFAHSYALLPIVINFLCYRTYDLVFYINMQFSISWILWLYTISSLKILNKSKNINFISTSLIEVQHKLWTNGFSGLVVDLVSKTLI